MNVLISSHDLSGLLRHAGGSPGVEVCGLLLGASGRIEIVAPCDNVAPDSARAFEIDPRVLIAAHRRARGGGPAVVGHYHSHPSGAAIPSDRDAAQAMGDGAVWFIIGGGSVRAWRSVDPGQFVEVDIVAI